MATNIEHRLTEWHQERFGDDNPAMIGPTYRKLCEEVGELGEALIDGDHDGYKHRRVREEAGDVAATLLHLLRIATGHQGLGVVMAMVHDKLMERQHRDKTGAELLDTAVKWLEQVADPKEIRDIGEVAYGRSEGQCWLGEFLDDARDFLSRKKAGR